MNSKLIYIVLMTIVFQAAIGQTKYALVFAIGNYPQQGGWPTISSSRDAVSMHATLLQQGFSESNITTITDANVTPQGISNAFDNLLNKLHTNDIIVIHFSAHGEQVEDDNGDETDGLDECIATYNAVIPSRSKDFKKDQAAYFRDDQFGYYINQIRKKLGAKGDVVAFIDACHSGTGTRGTSRVRGGQPPLVSSDFQANHFVGKDVGSGFEDDTILKNKDAGLASFEVVSATRAEEANYETTDESNMHIGSLTYAITKAFENLDPGVTYRTLFAKIQSIMHDKVPGQHPVLEGNGADREVLGGAYIQQQPYVEIEKIKDKQVTLKAGKFSGLDSGAIVTVYPAGTADPAKAKPLATGVVISAENYKAVVNLDKDLGIQSALGWVFIQKPVYKITPVSVHILSNKEISTGFSDNEIQIMQESLKRLPLIKLNGEPDLIIVKGEQADSIKIAANGYLFTTVKQISSNADELNKVLLRYLQYKFLQQLEIKDQGAGIDVKLVPVINGKADTTAMDTKLINGTYTFSEGDQFALLVKNKSNRPVYFNVLDMQPDGIINSVVPLKQKNIYPSDLKIDEGSCRLFDRYIISISPPYGTEVYKIFFSKKEIDMEEIAANHGASTRGSFTALEQLVMQSYQLETRGLEKQNLASVEGGVYNLLFEIKPKK